MSAGPAFRSWWRLDADAIWVLAASVRWMAAQCRRRADGGELGVCARPREEGRDDWLRPDADRRAEFERHQRRRSSIARCVVDDCSAGCGDGEAGADGCGAAYVSQSGAARQTGCGY